MDIGNLRDYHLVFKMKVLIENNLSKISLLEKELISHEKLSQSYYKVLNLTFFSKNWKSILMLPYYWFSVFIIIIFKEYFNATFIYYFWWTMFWMVIINSFLLIPFTIIYFKWLVNLRKIKILKLELELRFLYIKNLFQLIEEDWKNSNEQN